MALVKEVYGDEYKAADTSGEVQGPLAKKLLAKGSSREGDAVEQFVLLKLARDIAAQGRDGLTAFQAVEALASRFQIDAPSMKAGVLTKLQPKARTMEDHKSLAEQALVVLEQAVEADNLFRRPVAGRVRRRRGPSRPGRQDAGSAGPGTRPGIGGNVGRL